MSNLSIVIAREYLQRVRRKSFIISTLLMPVLMLGLMAAPALVAAFSGPEEKVIAVIDPQFQVAQLLAASTDNTSAITFVPTDLSADLAKADQRYDAVLDLGQNVIADPTHIHLYTRGAAAMQTESAIAQAITQAVRSIRIADIKAQVPEIDNIIKQIEPNIAMDTMRIDTEEEQTTSSVTSYLVGMVMSLMLYMFIMLYGQMVMTSIIEEKTNRVLEVVVSCVKPTSLMLGKILGIGAVALTQIAIWFILIASFTTFAMPSLTASLLNSSADIDLLNAINMLGNTGFIISLFTYLALFLIGGYLFYSAIYAAIGSAVDNIQDASQLQSLAMVPIILGLVFSMSAVSDPNSGMAFTMSIVPFTSPMVMMARLPFGIDTLQCIISLAILYISTIAMIWFAAKIYRVGIFMYGKKPTIAQMLRWARYK